MDFPDTEDPPHLPYDGVNCCPYEKNWITSEFLDKIEEHKPKNK